MKLSKQEIQLFDNISFSLSEEIDIFYSLHNNKSLLTDQLFDKEMIKEKLITIIDTLENINEGKQFQ